MRVRYLNFRKVLIVALLAMTGVIIGCRKDWNMDMYGCPEDFYHPSDSIIPPDSVPKANTPLEETL